MSSVRYLALLRGINVGGNNIIKMSALKSCFEKMGCIDVATFIQSGNVIFSSDEKNKVKLTLKIENELSKTFNYNSRIVLVTDKGLNGIIRNAPENFGSDPSNFRYDVIFLKEPLTAQTAMNDVKIREGVDNAYAGKNVLYFSRLTAKASQSRLPKIIMLPIYKYMTIRNWNTTTKLLALMDKVSSA
ncbi:MAG TPA: DUF1697 domain-containing protein [Ignavibacteriaceae bacterium]|nr:DUF1697 domain-containing protein [Ignavibacteriaceae bacterium]